MVEKSNDDGMEVVDLRFESLRDLQDDFGPFLSPEGFFLADRIDFDVSDVVRFRLMLPGDFVLVEGLGVVVWIRKDPGVKAPPGAAVGFATLSDQGRELVERIVHSHLEAGGKPFDMNSPAENGDSADAQGERPTASEPPSKFGSMKFTVRDESASDSRKSTADAEDDQRLPFEADAEPELLELEVVESAEEGVDSSRSESFELAGETASSIEQPEAQTFTPQDISLDAGQEAFEHEAVEADKPDPEPEPEFQPEPDLEPVAIYEPEPETEPPRAIAKSAFEVSLPEKEDSTPERRLWADDDVALSTEQPDTSNRRSGWLWVVLACLVLVAGGWVVWSQFPELLPWNQQAREEVAAVAEQESQEIVPPEEIPALTDEDVEAAVVAAVDAVTGSEKVQEVEPEPSPTVAPVVVSPVSGPASKIVEIKSEETEDGTVILIRGDGVIDSGRISTSELPSPPRVLVRISGIDGPFRPFVIPVENAEVREIRIGYHEETRPPSLWIVLDRADANVGVKDVQTSGNVIRVEVGR